MKKGEKIVTDLLGEVVFIDPIHEGPYIAVIRSVYLKDGNPAYTVKIVQNATKEGFMRDYSPCLASGKIIEYIGSLHSVREA